MARLFTSGAEMQSVNEISVPQGTVTIDTTTPASGLAAFSASCTASNYLTRSVTGAVSTAHFLRVKINPGSAYPTGNRARFLAFVNATTFIGDCHLETNGTVTLRLANGSALATSSAIPLNAYTMIELQANYPASGAATLTLRVDGVTIGSGAGSASLITNFRVGGHTLNGSNPTAGTLLFDDFALNDSTGTDQNSWPGLGKVVMLKPISDNARTGWTGGAGGTTNLFEALNNTPPIGVALLSATDASQIKDLAVNATDTYVANMAAYTTALASGGGGMAGTESVMLTQAFANGAPGAALAETLAVQSVSNPAGSEGTAATSANAGGTYPSFWVNVTAPVQYSPAPTLGTQPTVQLRKATSTASAEMYDFLGLIVEYLPAVTANVSESVATSESVGETLESFVAASEAASVAESVSRTLVSLVAATDSSSVSESTGQALTHNASASESVAASEALNAVLESLIRASEAATVSEALNAVLEANASTSEAILVSDAPGLLLEALIGASEHVTVSEAASVSMAISVTLLASVSESISVAESLAALLQIDVTGVEALSITDSAILLQSSFALASEAIMVAETAGLTLVSNVAVSDSTLASDSVGATLVSLIRSTESVPVAESTGRALSIEIAASQSVTAAEAVMLTFALGVAVNDTISTAEQALSALIMNVAVTEAIAVADQTALDLLLELAIAETLAVTDVAQIQCLRSGQFTSSTTGHVTLISTTAGAILTSGVQP